MQCTDCKYPRFANFTWKAVYLSNVGKTEIIWVVTKLTISWLYLYLWLNFFSNSRLSMGLVFANVGKATDLFKCFLGGKIHFLLSLILWKESPTFCTNRNVTTICKQHHQYPHCSRTLKNLTVSSCGGACIYITLQCNCYITSNCSISHINHKISSRLSTHRIQPKCF